MFLRGWVVDKRKQWWRGAAVVALSVAGLAGCQGWQQQQVDSGPLITPVARSQDGVPKLTPAQQADLRYEVARSFERRGDLGQAAAVYQEVVKLDPTRHDACSRLGILHDREGKFSESAVWYKKALALSPGNPDIFCNMGYSLYLQQRWAEAEMNLRQAIALVPDHARAHNNLGLVLAHTGRFDEALREFYKAGCGEADAHINLAFVLTLERRWDDARTQYERALTLAPNHEPAKKGLRELNALVAKAGDEAAGGGVVPASAPADAPAGGAVPIPTGVGEPAPLFRQ
jgi:Flp pilus assembly protein TadD